MFLIEHALNSQMSSAPLQLVRVTSSKQVTDPDISSKSFITGMFEDFNVRFLVSLLPRQLQLALAAGIDISGASMQALIGRHNRLRYGFMLVSEDTVVGKVNKLEICYVEQLTDDTYIANLIETARQKLERLEHS